MTQTVVITGVLGGIGSATAQLFQRQGWTVIGIDVHTSPHLPVGVDDYCHGNVANPADWERIGQTIAMGTSSIQGLVNNAAIQVCKPLIETTPEEWDQVMAVNLKSVYLGVRQLYPLLNAEGGAVVNVSSVHAVATSTQIAAYAASKGGMVALTRAMALELAPQIRVNALLPGAVDTQMLRDGLSRGHVRGNSVEELVAALGEKHVMGRVGKPEEMAEAIYFLIDKNRSSFMTGQTLVVDGGATIRLSTE